MLKTFCIQCGEVCYGNYCEDCAPAVRKEQRGERTTTAHQQGYGSRWTRLSRKARKLQQFCSDCGRTDELQADHSPEAWRRHYAGKAIRLKDISVVCASCNRARGQAHPGGRGSSGSAEETRRSGQA